MSAATAPIRTPYPWPADLLEFARRHGVADQLEPMLEVTRRLFPTAQKISVVLELDPELHDTWSIIYDVWVDGVTVEQFRAIKDEWYDEYRRILNGPDPCLFVLLPHWSS